MDTGGNEPASRPGRTTAERDRVLLQLPGFGPKYERRHTGQIRALRDIPRHGVEAGDVGGSIDNESNLSQEGDAWVGTRGRVRGLARVEGDAFLQEGFLSDRAVIRGRALVGANSTRGPTICGAAIVEDDARVFDDALVEGPAHLKDHCVIAGYAHVEGVVAGRARIGDSAKVAEGAAVGGSARVGGLARVERGEALYENRLNLDRLKWVRVFDAGENLQPLHSPLHPKYCITDQTRNIDGVPTCRIKALRDIERHGVKAGDQGGFVQSAHNLSHDGDAWIGEDAVVIGLAAVTGDSLVTGCARLLNLARTTEASTVTDFAVLGGPVLTAGTALVRGHARLYSGQVVDNARVEGDSVVTYGITIGGNARLSGEDRPTRDLPPKLFKRIRSAKQGDYDPARRYDRFFPSAWESSPSGFPGLRGEHPRRVVFRNDPRAESIVYSDDHDAALIRKQSSIYCLDRLFGTGPLAVRVSLQPGLASVGGGSCDTYKLVCTLNIAKTQPISRERFRTTLPHELGHAHEAAFLYEYKRQHPHRRLQRIRTTAFFKAARRRRHCYQPGYGLGVPTRGRHRDFTPIAEHYAEAFVALVALAHGHLRPSLGTIRRWLPSTCRSDRQRSVAEHRLNGLAPKVREILAIVQWSATRMKPVGDAAPPKGLSAAQRRRVRQGLAGRPKRL